MPLYSATAPIYALYPGDEKTVVSAETLTTGQESDRVAIGFCPGGNEPGKLSVEIVFSADPGAFTLDVQEADTDTDAAYINVPVSGTVTTVNTDFRARVDLVPFSGKFARLKQTLQSANVVTLTAKLIR